MSLSCTTTPLRRLAGAVALAGALTATAPARAHGGAASEASALSLLPVAVLVAAPSVVLAGAGALTVVSVGASATGAVWVLERAADGARFSLRVSGQAAGGVSLVAGTALQVTTLGSGWLLSAAGQALAFVPNAVGLALLHQERVTR